MTTYFFHSEMVGAPTNTSGVSSTLDIIGACLVTGFNLRTVASASVAGGVMTIVYGAAHGYSDKVWIRLDGADGGPIVRRATLVSSTQISIPAAEFPAGAVSGSLSTRVAPADWERPFSGTNIGVFRSKVVGPGSSRMFYRFQDSVAGGNVNMLRGYETMSDASTGVGPFPTFAQISQEGGMFLQRSDSSTAHQWAVVADERTAYIGFSNTSGQRNWNCIGDAEPYNLADPFCAVAIASTPAMAQGRLSNGGSIGLSFSPRAVNGLGGAVQAASINVAGQISGGTQRAYPSPVDGGLAMIRPIPLLSGPTISQDALRGNMRGLLHCFANPMPPGEFWRIFEPVTGVAGRVLVVRESGSDCVAFAIDEDWV